jgi:hypothetical protein
MLQREQVRARSRHNGAAFISLPAYGVSRRGRSAGKSPTEVGLIRKAVAIPRKSWGWSRSIRPGSERQIADYIHQEFPARRRCRVGLGFLGLCQ